MFPYETRQKHARSPNKCAHCMAPANQEQRVRTCFLSAICSSCCCCGGGGGGRRRRCCFPLYVICRR